MSDQSDRKEVHLTTSKKYTLSYCVYFQLAYQVITKTGSCNILQFFTAIKMINLQMKKCDILFIFAQIIDCGHKLEQPH